MDFDAVVVVSFGGPEGPDDVMPFLENVLRGRPVPPERLLAVAAHYHEFGGRSPLNDHNRALQAALQDRLAARGNPVPVYLGNRNWHPTLADTVRAMAADGVTTAAAFVTSAYCSYSGCRQYLEDIAAAREATAGAPRIVKLPPFFDRPGFVEPLADGLRQELSDIEPGGPDAAGAAGAPGAPVFMTAHSIPTAQADGYPYERQLRHTAEAVANRAGIGPDAWKLVFQSRSGPPSQPWLGPDILDAIRDLPSDTSELIVVPIGFVSDHMEVVYDLDRQAADLAAERGIKLRRTATAGLDPRFVDMICDLVAEANPGADPASTSGCCGPAAR